tara:strand:- start:827 stop:1012 length:186 start_codon:yes stop_codon:yes gene_type:complete
MPIWLRKFTYKEIVDFYDEEKKQMAKAHGKGSSTVVDSSGKVNPSNVPHFSKGKSKKTEYK